MKDLYFKAVKYSDPVTYPGTIMYAHQKGTTMSFLQEKQSRRFFILTGVYSAMLLAAGLFLGWLHGRETQAVLIRREERIVSSLLEQEVSAEIVAASLKNTAVTSAGTGFLQKAGHASDISVWLLAEIRHTTAAFCITAGGLAVISGVFLLLAVMYFLAEREKLYEKAAAMVMQFADGNFEKHLPMEEPGTIYRLFAAADQLAASLQAGKEAERHAKDFLRDIISDISHQIKTPLAALTMYTEIIMDEPDHTAAVKEFSAKSMHSLDRIEQLLQSLLKVARLDAGSIVFEKGYYAVSEVVFHGAEHLLTRAEAEGKQIIFQGNDSEMVFCDPEWMGEAVGNLIKNALDHTDAGGTVRIRWERTPAMLRLSVADDGNGISQEDIHHIFKRFYRSRTAGNRQGIGLGLPLAKAIIEGQGGLITVQSTAGEGTEFTVLLPLL